MEIETNADVAGAVRGAAAQRRITQQELAAALNLSEMAMSRRMNGITPFSPAELIRASRHCGVGVASFFGEVAA